MWNLRVFVADGTDPVGGFDVVLATGFTDALAAALAQRPAVHDSSEGHPAAGATAISSTGTSSSSSASAYSAAYTAVVRRRAGL